MARLDPPGCCASAATPFAACGAAGSIAAAPEAPPVKYFWLKPGRSGSDSSCASSCATAELPLSVH